MNFVIVGAGALGSIIGAQLLDAGQSVVMLARGARAEALRRDGIRLHGLQNKQVVCQIETNPNGLIAADVVILAVKTLTHETAAKSLAHMEVNMVFSVANGVLKNQQLAHAFGDDHVLGCMADISGELEADGRVKFTRNVGLILGELHRHGTDRCQSLVDILNASGVNADVVADVRSVEWSKFVGWCPFMALAVLSRAPSAKFLRDEDHAVVMAKAVREMYRLATALGMRVEDRSPFPIKSIAAGSIEEGVAHVLQVGERMAEHAPEHRMSALQDLERRTPLEVEATLGHAVVLGRQHDVAMPTMETLHRLVAGVDRQNRNGP